MWQHYYGAEPWDTLDTVLCSFGQKTTTAPLPMVAEETPEQLEARILAELGAG